jgi:hypothetical protein
MFVSSSLEDPENEGPCSGNTFSNSFSFSVTCFVPYALIASSFMQVWYTAFIFLKFSSSSIFACPVKCVVNSPSTIVRRISLIVSPMTLKVETAIQVNAEPFRNWTAHMLALVYSCALPAIPHTNIRRSRHRGQLQYSLAPGMF